MARRLPPPPPPPFHSVHVLVLHCQRVYHAAFHLTFSFSTQWIELHPELWFDVSPCLRPNALDTCVVQPKPILRHHLPQVPTALQFNNIHRSTTYGLVPCDPPPLPLSIHFHSHAAIPPFTYPFVDLDMFVNLEYVTYQLR